MIFKNREEAALLLLKDLQKYKNTNSIVLSVPRGGVPLGYVISRELNLPLDIILSKKIGHPLNPEYAVGWVTLNDAYFGDHPDITEEYFQSAVIRIREELKRKYQMFRDGKAAPDLAGKTVLLTDDGIATGNTLYACIESIKKSHPAKIVVAVPVAPSQTAQRFRKLVDEFICLYEPDDFIGVGQFYTEFYQVSDEEVIRLLS